MSDKIDVVNVENAFQDQAPGTSGLRKKVTVFQQPHYLESFVQAIFDSLPAEELKGSTLVLSGDGRFYNQIASLTILRMAAANGVSKIIAGQGFLMSTPAVSAVIRHTKANGGIILTASHNPGGPTEDFGIKYNISNGGPAPEKLTTLMFEKSKTIRSYKIWHDTPVDDYEKIGSYSLGPLQIEIVDPTEIYTQLMKSIFDFDALKRLIQRKDFSFVYDSMSGVAGPFARRIFIKELGASEDCLQGAMPLPDFGGHHPDPNLTYAAALVARMGLSDAPLPANDPHHSDEKKQQQPVPDFGAAADGDADRNMILGRKFFVTPSDSVAIIAAYAAQCIPYFQRNGVKGVARSMPTSEALDRVATKLGISCYEVPTGWKFFGNLMDAGRLSICGEESFGTGSDHIREKDGLWAVLAWMSILEYVNRDTPSGSPLVSVENVVERHWATYGRNYYSRYDYENVDAFAAKAMMAALVQGIKDKAIGSALSALSSNFTLKHADEFEYKDPVDGSVSAHQGIRLMFTDGSRIVYRLSGTGSVGATVRIYIEKYETDSSKLGQTSQEALSELISIALKISKIQEFTGRDAPTVIT